MNLYSRCVLVWDTARYMLQIRVNGIVVGIVRITIRDTVRGMVRITGLKLRVR